MDQQLFELTATIAAGILANPVNADASSASRIKRTVITVYEALEEARADIKDKTEKRDGKRSPAGFFGTNQG